MPPIVGGQLKESSCAKRTVARRQHVVLVLPTIDDILLGDSEQFRNHPGNLHMHITIQKYMKFFVAQRDKSREKLVILTKAIYRDIVAGGVRFLKQIVEDKNEWVEATKLEGLRKIGQAIREGPRDATRT